jgi:DNA-binding response OmpR family regulator
LRLLVVEDDPHIAQGLTHALRRSGYSVDALGDGIAADLRLATENYDLLILDVGLPGMDGHEVLHRLRARGKQTPVLILTARDALDERVRGLDGGADDYLVKPCDLVELEARIRAVTRRSWGRSGSDLVVGGLRLLLADRCVLVGETPLELSPREFGVLECLMLRHGRVVSKAQLQEHLSERPNELSEGAIEIHVHRLRKKIESADVELRTVRGFGYLLRSLQDAAKQS